MGRTFNRIFDALTLSPEAYHSRYPAKAVVPGRAIQALTGANRPLYIADGGGPEIEAIHLLVSGGSAAARSRVIERVAHDRAAQGDAVVLLQSSARPIINLETRVQYDPLRGLDADSATSLLINSLNAEMGPYKGDEFCFVIQDEMDYLAKRKELDLAHFAALRTREVAKAAFYEDNDDAVESHTLPEARFLEGYKHRLLSNKATFARSFSIRECKPGQVVPLSLSSSTAAMAFAEIDQMQKDGIRTPFIVLDANLLRRVSPDAASLFPANRCIVGEDLPNKDWIWRAATDSLSGAFFLRHSGSSAETISTFFGEHEIEKVCRTTTTGESTSTSDSLLSLFGCTTTEGTSTGTSVAVSTAWERCIPARSICRLQEGEGYLLDASGAILEVSM